MKPMSVFSNFPKKEEYLIEILLAYQAKKPYHHLTEEDTALIANHLSLPESHVCSVVSFYSFFSTTPRGKHIIQVCRDVPCHVNGALNVLNVIKQHLAIEIGETTKDRLFTLELSSCLGCCDQSPAIRINEHIYTGIDEKQIIALLTELRGDESC